MITHSYKWNRNFSIFSAMKTRLLIVEDEAVIAADMADMLEDFGYDIVDTVIDYSGAIAILDSEEVDLVIIDIMLGGSKSGIELAKAIRENYQLPFIFLTSHSDQATVESATATKPNGYLIKPFEVDNVYVAIEAALSNFFAERRQKGFLITDSLFIKSDRAFVKVKFSDILWLEADGNYIKVITDGHKHLVRSSFGSLLEKLPLNKFFKIHKSFYVNIDKVEAVNHTFVIVKGTELPLSRNYKEQLHQGINRIA